MNGQNGVARVCPVPGGSNLTFEYHFWPDARIEGGIDPNHKGPCAVYMKKVDDPTTDKAVGGGWFKIFEEDYDTSTNQWCTEKYILPHGHFTVPIPGDLAGGYYLVRPELLALHQADKDPHDPQFYVGCAQIFLESSGSSVPKDTVSIPGYVDMSKPAMTYNIWTKPLSLPFPSFGPSVYTGSSKRSVEERGTQTQTIGNPSVCEFQNNNFCGHKLAHYTDEASCYAVCSPSMILYLRVYTNFDHRVPPTAVHRPQHATRTPDPRATETVRNWRTIARPLVMDVELAKPLVHCHMEPIHLWVSPRSQTPSLQQLQWRILVKGATRLRAPLPLLLLPHPPR